jgi:hypothetical protein
MISRTFAMVMLSNALDVLAGLVLLVAHRGWEFLPNTGCNK